MSDSQRSAVAVSTLEPVVADPGSLRPLHHDAGDSAFVEPESGTRYPYDDGIFELLPEHERHADLGDERFYERHSFGFRHWQDWDDIVKGVEPELRTLIEGTSAESLIFDIGCGEGRISIYLAHLSRKVVAVDFTRPALINVAEHSNAICVRANNLRLPFKDEVTDRVISTGVIHHTPDAIKALRENCRVLKRGGVLYLRTYNRKSLYYGLYTYVGGSFRGLRRQGRAGAFITNRLAFGLYRLAFRVAKRDPTRTSDVVRSKFENYFMKDLVNFTAKEALDSVLESSGMEVLEYRDMGQSHHYVACKTT